MQTMNRTFLTGWDETADVAKLGVRQRVFGELVKLAIPLIQHYHSDLYHDVHWLDEHLNGPMTFFFGADDFGTAIGTDEGLVKTSRKHVWRVELIHKNDAWHLTTELLDT